ncbi:MAG: hypothetical protein EA353_04350 [Puniceicoccaceae bacterium]|nr:MAG: hypothetical protein EA353_04350 [Puniceicoccaceae bacterium]
MKLPTMTDQAPNDEILASRITALERHVTEQDTEIYRLAQKVDALIKVAKDQKAQLAAIAELSSSSADEMPADEKPPHY